MNGYVSRPRLVAIAMCLTVLVVVGVGYSQPDAAKICKALEELRGIVEDMMTNCGEYNQCQELYDLQESLTCDIDECWDIVDGVCSVAAA